MLLFFAYLIRTYIETGKKREEEEEVIDSSHSDVCTKFDVCTKYQEASKITVDQT